MTKMIIDFDTDNNKFIILWKDKNNFVTKGESLNDIVTKFRTFIITGEKHE